MWVPSSSLGERLWIALLLVVVGCASSPVVRTLPEFRETALNGKRVAFLRLAVSDDLGDARTGIVMSARTRTLATRSACEAVSQGWDAGHVVCLIPGKGEPTTELLEIERLYAEDRPIPSSLLKAVGAGTKSDFILLFRPESVTTVQEISQGKKRNHPNPTGPTWTTSGIHPSRIQTDNETELSYTVSAVLVNLATMKPLRGGLHSGSASRTVKNNVGFAAAPPAAPILAEIMAELGEAVLDD